MSFHVEHLEGRFWSSATRPWLVIERYYAGYKRGMGQRVVDRYATETQAKRRARDLNAR